MDKKREVEVKESAAEALGRMRSKKNRSGTKKPLFIFIGGLSAVVIMIGVVVGVQIVESNRIRQAQTTIAQLDINKTVKEPEFPENGDWDNDGIQNGAESRGGTNLQCEDTDLDGISDGDEKKLGTDPLDQDTDGDGLIDGYEIIAGTDPRKPSTDGTTNDADRVLTVTQTKGELTLTLTGNANIADTTIEQLDLFGITSNTSIVSGVYDIYSEYDFTSAKAEFRIDADKVTRARAEFTDLTVLRFDSDSLTYETVDSKADEAAGTVSADLNKFGTYVVGVERTVNDEMSTRIAFLIDNSASMYSKEYFEDSSENDVDFKRIDFTENLIQKIDGDYSFLISKFTGDYTRLQGFTDDKKQLESALEGIKKGNENFTGTHIQHCLEQCMNEFSAGDGYRNIIVMLTDGESDEVNPKSMSELSAIAEEKGVTVLIVGLGKNVDRSWLQEFAYSTGGKYYSASDANALDDVYRQIVTTLNYDIVNYGDDTESFSGYSLYETGFKPSDHGFVFKNFRTADFPSMDFGMAVFARDWYLGKTALTLGDIDPADESQQKYSAPGYDLRGTLIEEKFDSREPLKNILPSAMLGPLADVKEYLDYKSKGDTLKIDSDYDALYEQQGWAMEKYYIDGGNLDWTYVELLSLDIAGGMDKISRAYEDWEAQLYAAIYRLNALQWDDSEYEFNFIGGEEGFERLKKLLSQGVPVVTTIDDSRTVNAIGLIQDSECHRKYILKVYDSNYPGMTKEIYITKSPIARFEITDSGTELIDVSFQYSATYEGKQVGISFSDVPAH